MKVLGIWSAVLTLVVVSLVAPVMAAIHVVTPDGTGDFPTIQAAIDVAGDGDIIELTDGTFLGDGNRDIDVLGKAITVRSQSGNAEACIIDREGSPCYGFIFVSGEGPTSVLEALTITNGGHGSWYTFTGVYCEGASPTFTGCRIVANFAGGVGGMACVSGSFPTLSDCTFSGNRGLCGGDEWGANRPGGSHITGGIYCDASSSPTLMDCVLSENRGGVCYWERGTGGGMHCAGSPTLTRCFFYGNDAVYGGGMFVDGSGSPTLIDCTFLENEAYETEGGGRGGPIGGIGDGLYCSPGSSLTLIGCTIVGNRGDGFECRPGASLTLVNTIIAFNTGSAVHCGGISCQATFTCCDVYGNTGADWVDCIQYQYGINGNISEDPLFCDWDNGNLTLRGDSPCAPFSPPNEECDLIGAWPVSCGGPTGIPAAGPAVSSGFRGLSPNPFSPSTTIRFELARFGDVHIRIYDVGGHLVRRLDLLDHVPGASSIDWDGTDDDGRIVPSGTYIVELEMPGMRNVARVTMIK